MGGPEPGIIERCVAGLGTTESLGWVVEPAVFKMSPERVWEAWLVWRYLLVSANLRPLLANPANRDLIKPEALWEADHGAAVTGPQITQASAERTLFYASITALFDRFDVLTFAWDTQEVRHLRAGREMKLANALTFMANERVASEDAVSGERQVRPQVDDRGRLPFTGLAGGYEQRTRRSSGRGAVQSSM